MVSLSMSVRGLLPWASMSDESGKDTASRSLFKKGMGMRVLVRNVDKEQHRLIFTLKGVRQVSDGMPDYEGGLWSAVVHVVLEHLAGTLSALGQSVTPVKWLQNENENARLALGRFEICSILPVRFALQPCLCLTKPWLPSPLPLLLQ